MKAKYQLGDTIGDLTVTKVYRLNNKRYCDCSCSCGGALLKITSNDIDRKLNKHCGASIHFPSKTKEASMLRCARHRAKVNELPFDIEIEDIIIPSVCPLLEIPLILDLSRIGPNSPSLDRLIPSLGYVKGNVSVISHRANTLKNNASIDELMLLTDNLHKLIVSNSA
tara:strand:+ start:433 stop:936 length:504 start_codon:yes stop_codon:yes gene_type:complete